MACDCEQKKPWARVAGFGYLGMNAAPADGEGDPGNVGMANPSATNCINKGGTNRTEVTPAGDKGWCDFPDGRSCGAWEMFRNADQDCHAAAATVSRWDAKRDLLAGGVGLGLPIAYGYLAPKKWPQLNVFAQLAMVVVGYFGTVWVYKKLQE